MDNAMVMTPEMSALKAKLKDTWNSGDFGKIAESFVDGAEAFVERLNLTEGTNVLDVACGTGNQSIPAARAGAKVTGVDIAPILIEKARQRAESEKVEIDFSEGDAESLDFDDASFDVVMSMFGAMFAPRPEKVAAELVRVCRPGGMIAMGNWPSDSFIGQMFKIVGSYVPPPAGMPSPLLWANQDTVRERFGRSASLVRFATRTLSFRYPFGVSETIDLWLKFYGPTFKAYNALDDAGKEGLRRDLIRLWEQNNLATDGSTHVKSDYLEVLVFKAQTNGNGRDKQ